MIKCRENLEDNVQKLNIKLLCVERLQTNANEKIAHSLKR